MSLDAELAVGLQQLARATCGGRQGEAAQCPVPHGLQLRATAKGHQSGLMQPVKLRAGIQTQLLLTPKPLDKR